MTRKPVIQAHDSQRPESPVFSGHESFPIRFTWLTKAIRRSELPKDRDVFAREDAMVLLGVGKNMVRSMRFWATSTAMLEPEKSTSRVAKLRPTDLGSFLFGSDGQDPFMEDPATVWLLHWALASNRRLATWFFVFNELRDVEFDRKRLLRDLQRQATLRLDRDISPDTLERDIDCLIRTYVPSDPDKRLSREELLDCPLTELDLIRRSGDPHSFVLWRGPHETLPQSVFCYTLLKYWETLPGTANSVSYEQLAYAPGSPGQVFKLSENALIDHLMSLDRITRGAVRYDDTSGVRQIFRSAQLDPMKLLRSHYSGRGRREAEHARAR